MDNVSLFAGTSTGGILALLFSVGYRPSECVEIYKRLASKVFGAASINPLAGAIGSVGMFKAKYRVRYLKDVLDEHFGAKRLGDLDRYVLITAFRVDGVKSAHALHDDPTKAERRGWRPAIFSNLPTVDGVALPDDELLCTEAALRTSAAPTLFPLRDGYADGGIFAGNPSLLAVSKALAHFPPPLLRRDNVRVLSVGCGMWRNAVHLNTEGLTPDTGDWGLMQWAPHFVSLLVDSSSLSTELLISYLLQNNNGSHRIDPIFTTEKFIPMDDPANIPRLIELADEVDLGPTLAFIEQANENAAVTTPEISSDAEPYWQHSLDAQQQELEDEDDHAISWAKSFVSKEKFL